MIANNINKYKLIALIIFILIVGLFYNKNFFSLWEKLQLYTVFGPNEINYNFEFPIRGNLVNGGHLFIDIAKLFTNFLGFNLFNVKILFKIYGIISLLFFYLNLRFFVSINSSIITTILLTINFSFLNFQNSFLIIIFGFLVSNICLYLILSLNNRFSIFKLFLLFNLIPLILFNYVTIQLVCIPLIIILILKTIFYCEEKYLKNNLFYILLFSLYILIILFLLDPNDIYRQFLVYKNITSKELTYGFKDFYLNIHRVLESLISSNNYITNQKLYGYEPMYKFNYFNTSFNIIFFILGFLYLKRINFKNIIVFTFLFLSIFPLLFSFHFNEYKYSSLSIYRLFLSFIPIYIISSYGIELIFKKFKFSNLLIIFILLINFYYFYKSFDYLNLDFKDKMIVSYNQDSDELWERHINEINKINTVLTKLNEIHTEKNYISIKLKFNYENKIFPGDLNFIDADLDFLNTILATYLSSLQYNIFYPYNHKNYIIGISGVGMKDNIRKFNIIDGETKYENIFFRNFKKIKNSERIIIIYYEEMQLRKFIYENNLSKDSFYEIEY